jgi:hypothetical protein
MGVFGWKKSSPHEIASQHNGFGAFPASSHHGLQITRQSAGHIRLTARQQGGQHITVPQHQPWKGGTVDAMLSAVAGHFSLDRKELIKFLFD